MSEVIAFSKDQQAAVFGHALRDATIWNRLEVLGVTKEWFLAQQLQVPWHHAVAYRDFYNRPPTPKELLEYVSNKESADVVTATKNTLGSCLKLADSMGFDSLGKKLTEWAKSRIVLTRAKELAKKFSEGNHDEVYKLWHDGATELLRLDAATTGGVDQFESAADRVKTEEDDRRAGRVLDIGIPFLKDAFVSIIHHDLVLIGARPGAGKTELAKMIAQNVAKQGKRVAFFALEAEKNEIERRIKFSLLSKKYKADRPGEKLRYRDWRLGKYDEIFRPLVPEVEAEFVRDYSTLRTYYREHSDFGIAELDREILKVYKDTDLIVLDHLHYVDLEDGKDENRELATLVKRLRHIALDLGVPVICVAHIRKKMGGEAKSLCPDLEAYHGSSNISKVATKAVMLAPARGFVSAQCGADGAATFVRVVKDRLFSDALHYVAVAFYDREEGAYRDNYALGQLNFTETKWTPLKSDPPDWAHGAKITDVSEVE